MAVWMSGNISRTDLLLSKVALIARAIRKGKNYALISYPVLKNWYAPALHRAGLIKKLRVVKRSNKVISPLFNIRIKIVALLSNGLSYNTPRFDEKHLYLNYRGRNLLFFYNNDKLLMDTLEQLKDLFISNEYSRLQVRSRDVVDIGASIGDSAVYFSVKGARHVYAFEPYPYIFRIAQSNVRLNGLSKKVVLLNECLGGAGGSIRIDSHFQSDENSVAANFRKGRKIRVVTLEDVVNRYRLKDAVLKIDCEGEEYAAILNSKIEVLRSFGQIMIEYHYGYKNLESKLRDAGFKVWHERPFFNFTSKRKKMYQGLMLATKQNRSG